MNKVKLLKKYSGILPEKLIEIWREKGFCNLLDGYLRVINPEDYAELLFKTYFRGNVSIAILTTAFGDVITFEEGEYIGLIKYKNGHFNIISKNFTRFWENIEDEYFKEKYFEIQQYEKAVQKLGKLCEDECYGYVPLLGTYK